MAVKLIPCEIEGEVGLDVVIANQDATVADLIQALQQPADDSTIIKPYHKQRYGVCRGCVNNCCKYNSIVVDLVAAERLSAHLGLSLRDFAHSYLSCHSDLPFPEFKRRPCPFLVDDCCTVYVNRALICRLYLCTPMTERLEKLRAAVLLMGEAALRQRLLEEGVVARHWQERQLQESLYRRYRSGALTMDEFEREQEQLELLLHGNPFLAGKGYDDTKLRECCSGDLWLQICNNIAEE